MRHVHTRFLTACTAVAALLAGLAATSAFADEPAAAPALQARLDALQHITVTEARPPAAGVPAPSAAVDAALRDAAEAEATPAEDGSDAMADGTVPAAH